MSLLVVLVSLWIFPASAQVDPSSAALLGSSKSTPNAGLQSGRYETSATEPPRAAADMQLKSAKATKSDASVATIQPPVKKTARKTLPDPHGIPVAVIQPKIPRWTASSSEPPAVETPTTQAIVPEPKTESTPAPGPIREEAAVEEETESSEVEIEILTGLAHADAKSNTTYRQYSLTSALAGVGGIVWLNEHMGFSGRYRTTLSADIGSATDANSRVPVTAEWSELHWNFRRDFGSGARAPSLQYGLAYFENNLKAPADDATRSTLKSSGFGLDAKLRRPGSKSHVWIWGTALYPRIRNAESSGSGGRQSGSEPESSRLDLLLGGDFRLASTNTIAWDLSMNLEKNQFGGASNVNEPNGSAAQNVSVLTTTVFFHLGYRWGR